MSKKPNFLFVQADQLAARALPAYGNKIANKYWDRYRHDDIDMPSIPAMTRDKLVPHSQRLYDHIGVADAAMTEGNTRIARHAYYGAVSYIDDLLGALIGALQSTIFADNTIVIFLSDHGEALGERGLWFKRSFFDCALQVPLIITSSTRLPAGRCDENVSLIDLFPTVIDLANSKDRPLSIETSCDGRSLHPLLEGGDIEGSDLVFAELTSNAMEEPAVMVMAGRYKYIHCKGDPPQLYNRAIDWKESENLAGRADVAEVETRLAGAVAANWDLEGLKQSVLESQRQRRLVDRAHAVGMAPSWDYDAMTPGKDQYFRPCATNPSAGNYNSRYEVRLRPESEVPNIRKFP